ncbi:Xaa-Pro peptidase family protein [Cytobacillus pseudoceanisediminis]|uniref:Xaa-Pro peptidase family protein n=1 Tax=Cytobacillus pseudoceanisediminis TaxID=3051614 RepID=A0ABZ2ZBX3_9BACI|nr:Xaa-Pro peptidase family protein [Cytobacillus oceanisediminis]MCS0823888.1 Xaa-Pro peptidase family protein [Cytobacillus firmus]QOK29114.1 aminopeptidase P family protein [Cytobacillus oceanisediminis]
MDSTKRINRLKEYMKEQAISAVFVFNPDHQFYLTNFKALIYSRPIIFHLQEKTAMIVPGLEETHALEHSHADDVLVYYEHPDAGRDETSHMEHISALVKQSPKSLKIGVDLAFIPGEVLLYLQELGYQVVDIGQFIYQMRFIKDEDEIHMLEQAGQLVNLAVSKSLAQIQAGTTEMEIDAAGNAALFEATSAQYPDSVIDVVVMSPSGLKRSIMPHVFSNTRKIEAGDVIIHSRQVGLNGYRAELERTVIVGKPTSQQEKAFQAAIEAQQRAIDFIKPGVKFSEVDGVAREVFEKAGLEKYAIHRTGHGIGVSAHEQPFLRYDHHDVVEEGMAFSIEPGIYIPGVGGFRHSDTVLITPDGCRLITEYPRDMESLLF